MSDWMRRNLATERLAWLSSSATASRYDRARIAAATTIANEMTSDRRGNQRAVASTVCSQAVLVDADMAVILVTFGPTKRSCEMVNRNRAATSPSFAATICGQVDGCIRTMFLCANRNGPVMRSTAMAPHTTGRKRRAEDRNSATASDVARRLLTSGANTKERNTIPPIQATAARIWSEMAATQIKDMGIASQAWPTISRPAAR